MKSKKRRYEYTAFCGCWDGKRYDLTMIIYEHIYIYMKIQHEKKWWWNFEARRMVIER
jgi:hypothetical protein